MTRQPVRSPEAALVDDEQEEQEEQGPSRAEIEAQLALVPRRLAEWEEHDGLVVVVRPRPTTRGLAGLRDHLHYLTAPGRVRLDEVGSAIWRGMDGTATIADLAALVPPEAGPAPDGSGGGCDGRAEAGGEGGCDDEIDCSDSDCDCDSEIAARRVGLFLRVLLNHELASLEEAPRRRAD